MLFPRRKMTKKKTKKTKIFEPLEKEDVKPYAKKVTSVKPPAALKPGNEWTGEEVEITSDLYDSPNPNWDEVLLGAGYSPDEYEVVEPVKIAQWDAQTADGIQTLWSYKFGVQEKQEIYKLDYADLVREVKKHRKIKKEDLPKGDSIFFASINDWQIGKGDGHGLKGTVDSIVDAIDLVEIQIRDLRKSGTKIGTLVVMGLGDIVENCEGHYATQTFSVEANRRQQTRIARRLVRDAVCRWSKLFAEVYVLAVPGNHGENRNASGKVFTSPGDNDDVAVFEQVAEILATNPDAYGHVKFIIPEDDVYLVHEFGNTVMAFFHGHITKGGADPRKKLHDWWAAQIFADGPLADAKILVTAHYHHLSVIDYGVRVHMQAPAFDGGSTWWENLGGGTSRAGILTFVIDHEEYPKNITVIGGTKR